MLSLARRKCNLLRGLIGIKEFIFNMGYLTRDILSYIEFTCLVLAEFGNHDMERHTAEYLKDFVIFPQVKSPTLLN